MSKQQRMTTAEFRAMALGKQTENEFESEVIKLAALKGWRVIHHRPARTADGGWATPMKGDPGFPDLVLARAGRVIFAELKSATGKLAPDQKAWIEAINGRPHRPDQMDDYKNCNPAAYEWRPHDWETIERLLA